MGILDYFDDWKVSAIPRIYGSSVDQTTGSTTKGTAVDSAPILGVKYNLSKGERLFAQTWADDVSDVFVTDNITGVTKNGVLVYGGVEYSIDGVPVNVGEQSEAWLIGLKVRK